jgi:hypothetical protein
VLANCGREGDARELNWLGFSSKRLHVETLPLWRGFSPALLFPRATASATVPTSRESAERRQEFSFWSHRRRHVHDTPRRFQCRTLAKSGRGQMLGTPQRVAPTCASLGRGLSKPRFAGLADNPRFLRYKKCMNYFPSIQLPSDAPSEPSVPRHVLRPGSKGFPKPRIN